MRFLCVNMILAIVLSGTVQAGSITEVAQAVIEKIDDKLTYQVMETPKLEKLPKDVEIVQKLHLGLGLVDVFFQVNSLLAKRNYISIELMQLIALGAATYHTDRLTNSLITGKMPTKKLMLPKIIVNLIRIYEYVKLYKKVKPSDLTDEQYQRRQNNLKMYIRNCGINTIIFSTLRYPFLENIKTQITNQKINPWLSLGANLYQVRLAVLNAMDLYPLSKKGYISLPYIVKVFTGLTRFYIQYRVNSLASQPAGTK